MYRRPFVIGEHAAVGRHRHLFNSLLLILFSVKAAFGKTP